MKNKKIKENNIILIIDSIKTQGISNNNNEKIFEEKYLKYKDRISFKKFLFILSIFLLCFFVLKNIIIKNSSDILLENLNNVNNNINQIIVRSLLDKDKEELTDQKNVIKLKFQVKKPKNPVLLFNKSNQEILNSIKQIEIGNKIYIYTNKISDKNNISQITNEFKFGFSRK